MTHHYCSGNFPAMDMSMRQYLDTAGTDEIEALASRAGTKVIYLRQIGCGAKQPSPKLARRLYRESGGKLSLVKLRPDVFGDLDQGNPSSAEAV